MVRRHTVGAARSRHLGAGTLVRVGVDVTGHPRRYLFTGMADTWHHRRAEPDRWVELGCDDPLSTLTLANLPEQTAQGAGETAGPRLERILTANGLSAISTRFDAGLATLQATTLADDALSLADLTADSDGGWLWVDGDGVLVYYQGDRDSTDPRWLAPVLTIGDDDSIAGAVCWDASPMLADDRDSVINHAAISTTGGTMRTADDVASQHRYQVRTFQRFDLIHQADPWSQTLADKIVARMATGGTRPDTVAVTAHNDAEAWTLLNLLWHDRVRVVMHATSATCTPPTPTSTPTNGTWPPPAPTGKCASTWCCRCRRRCRSCRRAGGTPPPGIPLPTSGDTDMTKTVDVAAGQKIASVWGNETRDRALQVFASNAERDAQWAGAPNGAHCVTLDTYTVWLRQAGAWVTLSPPQLIAGACPGGNIPNGAQVATGSIASLPAGLWLISYTVYMISSAPMSGTQLKLFLGGSQVFQTFVTPQATLGSFGLQAYINVAAAAQLQVLIANASGVQISTYSTPRTTNSRRCGSTCDRRVRR